MEITKNSHFYSGLWTPTRPSRIYQKDTMFVLSPTASAKEVYMLIINLFSVKISSAVADGVRAKSK